MDALLAFGNSASVSHSRRHSHLLPSQDAQPIGREGRAYGAPLTLTLDRMNTQVTITPTPEDYTAVERYIAESLRKQSRWHGVIKALGLIALVLLILGFIGLFSYEARGKTGAVPAIRNSALLILAAGALIGSLAYVSRRSIAGVLFRPGSRLLQPFTLSVSESGVAVESALGTANLPWSAFLTIELHGNYLFLFTFPNHAVVIPARAFACRSEFEVFAANLGRLRAKNAV